MLQYVTEKTGVLDAKASWIQTYSLFKVLQLSELGTLF